MEGPDDQLPVVLPSRYRAIRSVGGGGMSLVYLAEDSETDHLVAVKVLRREQAGAVGIQRFLLEIRVTGALDHPGIVPLLDSGESDGLPFLVMPFVDGETLRSRLLRERQLPLEEVVDITTKLADALDAAHSCGFVHRDVKPGNILLEGERVLLTDFGIARALSRATTDRITGSGLSIGTVGYMSPEQSSGESDVDARSDLYSLACVVYEMLAGEPPFSGKAADAVLLKHMSLPVPPLRVLRERLPSAVDEVLQRALAKAPVDRFASTATFAAALAVAAHGTTTRAQRLAHAVRRLGRQIAKRPRVAVVFGVLAVTALGVVVRAASVERNRDAPSATPDSVRYAVFPMSIARGVPADAPARATSRAVRVALLRWTDIDVVDEARVAQALTDVGTTSPTPREARRAARALAAGRYVVGEITPVPGGTEIRVRLASAVSDESVLAEQAAILPAGIATVDSIVIQLVASLLLGEDAPISAGGSSASLAARRAHADGTRALRGFDLPDADSAFSFAVMRDSRFASAYLGIALARLWRGHEPARWRIPAEQAALGSATLLPTERLMTRALAAVARDDLTEACAIWRDLTRSDSTDVRSFIGSAHCQVSDDVVIPDATSRSGWRFRTSYGRALADYERAFALDPRILDSFGGEQMESLRRLFHTAGSQLRRGRARPPSTTRFTANMTWAGESLMFVPYPKLPSAPHVVREPDARNEAMRHQRELVRAIASSWVANAPFNADAHHALALALAALGDPSAIDTLARARALAVSAEQRLRIAGSDLSLRLTFAVRDRDTLSMHAVRHLADSILTSTAADSPDASLLLASIAAVTGRASLAARLAAAPRVADALGIPPLLRDGAPQLLLLSALGGPADEIHALESRVAGQIARAVPRTEQSGRRLEILARAASMSFPSVRSVRLDSLAAEGDSFVALQARAARGDTAAVRRGLETIRAQRRSGTPETLTLDALAPEAALWLALGDAAAAARWLDPTLAVLPQVDPGALRSPLQAASLLRALIVRAAAAARPGAALSEQSYAVMTRILLSDADRFLRPPSLVGPRSR